MCKRILLMVLTIALLLTLGGVITTSMGCSAPVVPATPPATYPAPTPTPPPSPTANAAPVLGMTAFDIATKILDTRLSENQRNEIWQKEYKGKRVTWYAQSFGAGRAIVKKPGEYGWIDIRIRWRQGVNVQDVEKQLQGVNVFLFSGTLDNYDSSGFYVTEAQMDFLVFKEVWRREAVTLNGMYNTDGVLVASDQRYLYSWVLDKFFVYYEDSVYDWGGKINTYDKTNGYFVSETSFQFKTTHKGFVQAVGDKMMSMAQGQLVFAQRSFPFRVNGNGLIFAFAGSYCDVFDAQKNTFLWGINFPSSGMYSNLYSISGALASGQMIFTNSGQDISAFQIMQR